VRGNVFDGNWPDILDNVYGSLLDIRTWPDHSYLDLLNDEPIKVAEILEKLAGRVT
jgi:hypothetical protein